MSHPHLPPRRRIRCAVGTLLSLASCLPVLAGGAGQGLVPAHNYVVPSQTLAFDGFGSALAVGDFDGNGIADLAVGSPETEVTLSSGRVDLYLGHSGGLVYAGSYVGDPGTTTGYSLAAGDFDDDGKDELAVGAPQTKIASLFAAGEVLILEWNQNQWTLVTSYTQGVAPIGETAEAVDYFGRVLASGDFNGDGADDLAIGVPFETLGASDRAGLVHVVYGGPTPPAAQSWTQNSFAILGASGLDDYFGWALAAGDFDHDGFDDLAIGVPGEPAGMAAHSGGVNVLYGTGTGLSTLRNQLWVVGSDGVPGTPESVSSFGSTLSACDFNGDGWSDLAVGAPYSTTNAVSQAGQAYELHGSSTGLTGTSSRRWAAFDLTGSNGAAGENFGFALACGSFDGGAEADLAIGSPLVDLDGLLDVGVVDVIKGSSTGLTAVATRRFSSAGLASAPAADSQALGWALAAGDFDGNGQANLAVGIPNRVLGVQVLGDDLVFRDGFATGNIQAWSASVP